MCAILSTKCIKKCTSHMHLKVVENLLKLENDSLCYMNVKHRIDFVQAAISKTESFLRELGHSYNDCNLRSKYNGHGFTIKCIHQNWILQLLFLQNRKPSCDSMRDNKICLYIKFQANWLKSVAKRDDWKWIFYSGVGCIRCKKPC